jgi:hypothetical protein
MRASIPFWRSLMRPAGSEEPIHVSLKPTSQAIASGEHRLYAIAIGGDGFSELAFIAQRQLAVTFDGDAEIRERRWESRPDMPPTDADHLVSQTHSQAANRGVAGEVAASIRIGVHAGFRLDVRQQVVVLLDEVSDAFLDGVRIDLNAEGLAAGRTHLLQVQRDARQGVGHGFDER